MTEEGYVEFHPEAERRPYLQQAGTYGPGQGGPFEAECVVQDYQFPAKQAPPYNKNAKAEDFAYIAFRVRSESFGTSFVNAYEAIGPNSGSRMPAWLTSLGVEVGPAPGFAHKPADVVGKPATIKVGEPRQGDDGRWWNGRLQDVLGG